VKINGVLGLAELTAKALNRLVNSGKLDADRVIRTLIVSDGFSMKSGDIFDHIVDNCIHYLSARWDLVFDGNMMIYAQCGTTLRFIRSACDNINLNYMSTASLYSTEKILSLKSEYRALLDFVLRTQKIMWDNRVVISNQTSTKGKHKKKMFSYEREILIIFVYMKDETPFGYAIVRANQKRRKPILLDNAIDYVLEYTKVITVGCFVELFCDVKRSDQHLTLLDFCSEYLLSVGSKTVYDNRVFKTDISVGERNWIMGLYGETLDLTVGDLMDVQEQEEFTIRAKKRGSKLMIRDEEQDGEDSGYVTPDYLEREKMYKMPNAKDDGSRISLSD
jgi:hypothetical protein